MKRTIYSALLIALGNLLPIANVQAQGGTATNIFFPGRFLGFTNAGDLAFRTVNVQRARLNGNATANTTAGIVTTTGFLGLGNFSGLGGNVLGTSGPWSQLHIEGPNNTGFAPAGYRTWMRTGVFMNENSDNLYVGMKPDPSGVNRSDAVLNWGDDTNSPGGPDNMLFVYTSAPPPFSGGLSSTPNGREVARMTPSGNVGIGPVFTNAAAPQSMLHLNIDGTQSTWLQITNQTGTQQTATDGTRFGILGSANLADNGNAYLYNQENRHLIFSTNAPTPTSTANTLERVRITNIAAPTTLPLGGIGTYIPPGSTINSNFTRMSISEDPNNPVTRPLSLLHIGYNTGNILNATSTDGWRPWMDVGMFASQGTDNVYIGLKQEPSFPIDRYDAVINWGDNNAAVPPFIAGPDNMRFIFTSKTTGAGIAPAPANGANGVEGLRMTPIVSTFTGNSAIFTGIGGDPTTNLYSTGQNAGNALEINSTGLATTAGGSSGLRFTDLNSATPTIVNPGPGVLSVDANGDVIYVPDGGGAGLGNACGATPTNPLTSDWEIPLGGNEFYFSGQAQGADNVAIGLACNTPPLGKLHVERQYPGAPAYNNSASIYALNNDISLPGPNLGVGYGVYSKVTNTNRLNIAGYFESNGSNQNIGAQALANGVTTVGNNVGFLGTAQNAAGQNIGVQGNATASSGSQNVGGRFNAQGATNLCLGVDATALSGVNNNVGGRFQCTGATAGTNIALLARAFNATTGNYALFADGDIFINSAQNSTTGLVNGTSDIRFKTNIDTLSSALATIAQLVPKSFYFDTTNTDGMHFDSREHFGFIAQDVETVLPSLVSHATKPADYDSTGTIISPSLTFKTLSYTDFIAILTKGMQEQQRQIADLQAQINSCCSTNARTNHVNTDDVELRDMQSVVLDQNVPNPFAEQTTIGYFLPDNVVKAQMLFYSSEGKLINAVDLEGRGKGQINVYANDLSNGMYTYTLVADGKIMDTKRMVKSK